MFIFYSKYYYLILADHQTLIIQPTLPYSIVPLALLLSTISLPTKSYGTIALFLNKHLAVISLVCR